jgi:hypothetical protein
MKPRKDPTWYLSYSHEHVAYEFYMLRRLTFRQWPPVEKDRVHRIAFIPMPADK